MKLLLDTQLLLWAASCPERLSPTAMSLIEDPANDLHFSVASLWEIVIKRALGRADFRLDPTRLRRGLLENGYTEDTITAAHVLAIDTLPPIHKDPFDRLLLCQAHSDGLTLLTSDAVLARYPGPVRRI